MKRILFILIAVMFMASCTSSLPGQFTKLANEVETKGASFSEEQWQKANARFEKLVEAYSDNYDSFSRDQKKEINKAIAKYSSAAVKYGVGNVAASVQDIVNGLSEDLDGLLEGARDFLEGLGL